MWSALLWTHEFTFVPTGSAVAVWKSLSNFNVSPTWTLIVLGKNRITPTSLPLPAEVSAPTRIVYVVPAAEAGVGRRIRLASNARMGTHTRVVGRVRRAIRMEHLLIRSGTSPYRADPKSANLGCLPE